MLANVGTKSASAKTIYRFYCNNNADCSTAEKALKDAGLEYVKVDSDSPTVPILVAIQQTCRGLDDILNFVKAVAVMKKEYSLEWS